MLLKFNLNCITFWIKCNCISFPDTTSYYIIQHNVQAISVSDHNRIHATDVLHAVYYMTTQPVYGFTQMIPGDYSCEQSGWFLYVICLQPAFTQLFTVIYHWLLLSTFTYYLLLFTLIYVLCSFVLYACLVYFVIIRNRDNTVVRQATFYLYCSSVCMFACMCLGMYVSKHLYSTFKTSEMCCICCCLTDLNRVTQEKPVHISLIIIQMFLQTYERLH